MPADLHIHTCFSDGTQTPAKVVELAGQTKVTAIAITDHDEVKGVALAKEAARSLSLEIVNGIELTTENLVNEIHVLGLFIDINNAHLLEVIAQIQIDREKRIYKICDKLSKLGLAIDPEEIFSIAGHRAAGRPHVAQAMVKKGYVDSFKEAFNRYIDFRGPAYVAHYRLNPADAIKLIKEAKGLAIFAHPAVSNCDQLIPDLMAAGLDGIEVFYPSHGPNTIQRYLNLAEKYGLLVTGGTDFHGTASGREIRIADVTLPDQYFERLKNEYLHRNKP